MARLDQAEPPAADARLAVGTLGPRVAHSAVGDSLLSTRKRRTRRKRRQQRAALKHGPAAKPRHRLRAGRTGQVHSKKTPPRKRKPLPQTPPADDCHQGPPGCSRDP